MRLICFLVLLTATSQSLVAQGDTITRNPNAVQLKRIWKLEGSVPETYLGSGVGRVGDVNGDGLEDFAVYRRIPNYQWMVFYGSRDTISTEPVWAMDSGSSATVDHPVVGDFWGTGHRAVGFMRSYLVLVPQRQYDWLRIYRTDSNKLEQEPSAVWHSVDWRDTSRRSTVEDALAVDLDNDGDDELICVMASVYGDRHGELWIYEGGPNFQVDTPSVVLRDPEVNDGFFRAHAGDIDGDGRIDLMTVKRNAGAIKSNFYWGPFSSTHPPDRSVIVTTQTSDYSQFIELLDCDGDGVQDVIKPGTQIWRSGSGKNPRTRAWTLDDADIVLRSAGGSFSPVGKPGYLNSKRYEMVAAGWSPGAVLFSGGPAGPNSTYDATYYPALDGLQGSAPIRGPLGDVNGDGWDDAIGGTMFYPSDRVNAGIAVILAGGPYIPSDDPSVGVRRITLENKSNALSLWPNPVREELNIAWRGDLARMPRRFEVHDMLGRRVAAGAVPDGDGAAVWRCADQPAGAYLLSVFDASGDLLATTTFIKY